MTRLLVYLIRVKKTLKNIDYDITGPDTPETTELHYCKGGSTVNISLYDNTTDMVDYLQIRVGGVTLYAPLDTTGNSKTSDLRIRKGGTTYAVLTEWALS